jgi:hypothetical protein
MLFCALAENQLSIRYTLFKIELLQCGKRFGTVSALHQQDCYVFTSSTVNPHDSKLPSPKCPDEHWGPTTLLLNGYEGFFPKSKAVRSLS